MFEPTQKNVDQDVAKFVKMFQRAQVGEVAPVSPQRPRAVLLVLDGTSQDELAICFARHFLKWAECRVSVVDARENVDSNELAERSAESLGATALAKNSGDSFQQILDAVGAAKCDLIVVPCPYGRELETVGADSTGTVIDVLLSRSPTPLLIVRKPYVPDGEVFDQVLLVLIGENEAAPFAAAWGVGLVAHSGVIQLVLILEEEFYENVRELMQAIDPDVEITPESLGDALLRTHMRLHRSLQKTAREIGFKYELTVHREGVSTLPYLTSDQGHPLLVLALERADHSSQGHVHDRIRRSRHSLLVAPVD